MFENKVITFIAPSGNHYKGRVISCVKDIGISIVDDNNPKKYLYCLIMKNAPNYVNKKGDIAFTRKRFTIVRKGIIAGTIDLSDRLAGGSPSAITCPFGQ